MLKPFVLSAVLTVCQAAVAKVDADISGHHGDHFHGFNLNPSQSKFLQRKSRVPNIVIKPKPQKRFLATNNKHDHSGLLEVDQYSNKKEFIPTPKHSQRASKTTSSLAAVKEHQHQHHHSRAKSDDDGDKKSTNKEKVHRINIGDFHLKVEQDPIHMIALGGGGGIGLLIVACALIAFLYYVIRKFGRWWGNFDIRESFPGLGRWMLARGWDKFEAFAIVVRINSINEHREPYRLRVRFRSKIYKTPVCTPDGKWGCTTRIMVPQGCDRGEIEVIVGSGAVEGYHSFLVWETMLQQTPVNPRSIDSHPSTFFKKDHNIILTSSLNENRAGNVHMTFALAKDPHDILPIVHGIHPESYALAEAIKNHVDGAPARGNETLQTLAHVLHGPLIQGSGLRTETKYFAVVKRETVAPHSGGVSLEKAREQDLVKTRWLLGWWRDETEFRAKPASPVDYLSLLQCVATRADTGNATGFCVTYVANSGRHELQLNCGGLDREVWVDGLYLAIAEARNLIAIQDDEVTGCESIDVFLERASSSVRTRILIALCCCNACDAVETMSVGFMLNKLHEESTTTKTLLAASVFVGMFFGGILAGFLANYTGRKKVLVVALICQAIAALVGSLMPNIGLLIMMRLFSGLGIGATVPVLFILAPEIVAPSVRESYLTYITGSFSFGSVFVAIVAYISFEGFKTSWQIFYGWTALWPLLTAVVVIFMIPESPIYLAKRRKIDRLHASLSHLNPRATLAQVANVEAQPTDFGMQENNFRSFNAAAKAFFEEDKWMKIKLAIVSFVISWVWYGLSTWAISIFHNLGMDNPYLSALFFVICGAIGSITCIFIVQATGMKAYILFTFFIAMVAACMSIFLKSAAWAVTLACITNTAISGLFNAVVTYMSVVPLHDRPLSTGIFAAVMRVGSIGAQFLMGYYASAERQWVIHVVSTCLIAMALLATLQLPNINNSDSFKRTHKNAPIQTEGSG